MSTTLKLLSYSFGTTQSYARFGDASDNYLFMIQWGRYDSGSESSGFTYALTFPITFTSAPILIGSCGRATDATYPTHFGYYNCTTTGVTLVTSRDSSDNSAGGRYIDWVAIGT